jgi:integrase
VPGLERITYHQCRHTYASLMLAVGVNAKALSTYRGHANISITATLIAPPPREKN